jgi:hypothetical protein
VLTVLAVFVLWSVLDVILHVAILGPVYQASSELWRAPEAMKPLYIHAAVLLSAFVFTTIYTGFFSDKRPGNGLSYGFLWGAANGVAKGFFTYATTPVSFDLAVIWILGAIVEAALAGLLLGYVIKE